MNRLLRNLICLVPLFAWIGCGGVAEEKPPETAPVMTPEEQKHMEQEMEKMRKMYQPKKR